MENKQLSGLTFREEDADALIHFNQNTPSHLIFLLKGSMKVKASYGEISIHENEFFVVDPSYQVDCQTTAPSRFLMISMDKAAPAGMAVSTDTQRIQKHTIHQKLQVLLGYLMGTMPMNEEIKHHSISRVISSMMRTYHSALTLQQM